MLRQVSALVLPLSVIFGSTGHALECGPLLKSGPQVAAVGMAAVAAATMMSRIYTIKQIVKLSRMSFVPRVDVPLDPEFLARGLHRGDQVTIVSQLTRDEARQAFVSSSRDAAASDASSALFWGVEAIGENLNGKSASFDVWAAGSSILSAIENTAKANDVASGVVDAPVMLDTKVITVTSEGQMQNVFHNLRASGRVVNEISRLPESAVSALATSKGVAISAGAVTAVMALVAIEEHFAGKISADLQRRYVTGVCRQEARRR